MKMKYAILLLSFIFANCNNSNNCDILRINSNVESIIYHFDCKIPQPFKMDFTQQIICNDTIIVDNIKIGPIDTFIISAPADFYGSPVFSIKYERYKATEVNIEYKVCYY